MLNIHCYINYQSLCVFRFGSVVLTNCMIACISASITVTWLEINKRRKENKFIEVIFFNPLSKGNCRCRMVNGTHCKNVNCPSTRLKQIISCLKNATKSIDICVFALSNNILADVICESHIRGIKVRLIINNCVLMHGIEIKNIKSSGIPIQYQDDEAKYMHHKFCLVDSTYLINGSMNWTYQAAFENWENVLITNQPKITSEFSKCFENIWSTIKL